MAVREGKPMAKNNSILVIVDPTAQEQPAVARAAWLAQKLKCKLELFICDYDQYLAGERFFDTKALQKARAELLKRHLSRLEKLAAPLRDKGITVTCDTAWDHPLHEGILRKIEAAKARLVVKDTHYHSAIRRSLFSNTDWHVIRDCKSPLWLVKPSDHVEISTLLAAVDPVHERDKPAKLDHRILDAAEEIRAAIDGSLHVVHAFDPAPIYAVSTDAMSFPITEPINDAVDALRTEHQAAMDDLVKQHQPAPKSTRVIEGETREVLVGAVDELDADVVVIGAVSRGALKRLALGSTAERVLDFVPCDLLIVKPA
jgi:universal stress protein E